MIEAPNSFNKFALRKIPIFLHSRPTSAENEYVMKCIMRSFSTLQAAVIPYLSTLLTALTQKLQLAAKNPTKPHYNHYLFESLSLSIRIVCKEQPSAVANFESVLFPVFQEILQVSRALRKILSENTILVYTHPHV